MKTITEVQKTATDTRIKKYIPYGNPIGRNKSSVTLEIVNGQIDHCSYEFNGCTCIGADIEELRRFKRILNGFKNI